VITGVVHRVYRFCGLGFRLDTVFPDVATAQCGVISRPQALASGMSAELIRSRLARSQWQRLHRGIYATFSGPPPRNTIIWGALVAAGEGAVLSHHTGGTPVPDGVS
jgi:hypothetical protein